MDIILETDLGRDADDFFALCYLRSAGVNIRAITISPGDKDQISVAKFMLERLGLVGVPVGSAKPDREKSSVQGMHVDLLEKHGWPERMHPDGKGDDVIKACLGLYPNCELFCIGPLQSVGPYIRRWEDREIEFLPIRRSTMQGGFAGYHLYEPPVGRLGKFEGLKTCPTFNLGGDKQSSLRYVHTTAITNKVFVGKNVCHSIVYEPETLRKHRDQIEIGPKSDQNFVSWHLGQQLFLEAMQLFFDRGAPHKMFHDPTAAVCMLHPEIGTWIDGTVYYEKGGWGTKADGPHRVLVDIDRDKLWEHIFSGV
jgi:inosine-uridine nucleoside N-ribohydrolase